MRIQLLTQDTFQVIQKSPQSDSDLARLRRERDVLARLRIDGITRIFADKLDTESPALAFHRIGYPSAKHHSLGQCTLSNFRTPVEHELLHIFQQCAQLLALLHASGLAHGALSGDHILLDRNFKPVFCSFGRAVELDANRPAAQADVASLLATFEATLKAPSDPAWALRLRGGSKRLSHQLLRLVQTAAESRTATAADLSTQLSELSYPRPQLPPPSQSLKNRRVRHMQIFATHSS